MKYSILFYKIDDFISYNSFWRRPKTSYKLFTFCYKNLSKVDKIHFWWSWIIMTHDLLAAFIVLSKTFLRHTLLTRKLIKVPLPCRRKPDVNCVIIIQEENEQIKSVEILYSVFQYWRVCGILESCSHPINERSWKSDIWNFESIESVHSRFIHIFDWRISSRTACNWPTCYCYYQKYHQFQKMHF